MPVLLVFVLRWLVRAVVFVTVSGGVVTMGLVCLGLSDESKVLCLLGLDLVGLLWHAIVSDDWVVEWAAITLMTVVVLGWFVMSGRCVVRARIREL
jgi:hypothetical protein